MVPGYIGDLDDAYFWLLEWLPTLGGSIDPDPVRLDFLVDAADEKLGLELRPTSIMIGQRVLTVDFVLGRDLEPEGYRFDFRDLSGGLLWRHDKHPGHKAEHGTDCHVHRMVAGVERRYAVHQALSFEDVARAIANTP